MNLGDSWGKLLGVAGTGALAIAAYFSNPYAPFRPMPEMCPSQATCVIVAGLDGDVNLGVGAGGQPIGFDLDDEVRRQLVDWLENAPGDLRVYKMPEEIAMPERGVSSFERNAGAVVARARRIGEQYGAQLVVIGEVNSASVSLAFVDPNDTAAGLNLAAYELPNIGVPNNFLNDFYSALAAAREHRPAPTPIAARPAAATPPEDNNTSANQELDPPRPPPPQQQTSFPPPAIATPPPIAAPTVIPAEVRERPSSTQMQRAYPRSALERGISGAAVVRCYVALDGNLHTCATTRENPPNMGFGNAAERLARQSTTAFPQRVDGRSVADGPIEVEYSFQVNTEN